MRANRLRRTLVVTVVSAMLCGLVAPAAAESRRATPVTVRGATWRVRQSNSAGRPHRVFRYGRVGDVQVMGDWNRDGVSSPGVVRGNRWLLRNWLSGGPPGWRFRFGRRGDVPVVGDWNGDGRTTIGVVRGNRWLLRNRLSGGPAGRDFRFGRRGDVPVVGDWNGDGRTTIGVVRGNRWLLRNSNTGGPPHHDFRFGQPGEVPVVGDWNRDGRTTIGMVRGRRWRLRNHFGGGRAHRDFGYGACGDVFVSTQSARTTPGVPPSLASSEWTTLPTSRKVVALTFDAGANARAVRSILRTLDRKRARGTFFVTGRWLARYPRHGRAIARRFPMGNHTWSHPDLTTLSTARVRRQILDTDRRIRTTTGTEPRPWFRFPFGARDARTMRVARCLQYGSVRWTVDTLGWKGTSGGQSVRSVVRRVLDGLRPGAIVLMHVGSHPTDRSTLDADALPRIIDALRARGYGLVTLDRYG
jgi:peptidoglycan/xylan/chitin deacetylase (PgdA/CDA1 family)